MADHLERDPLARAGERAPRYGSCSTRPISRIRFSIAVTDPADPEPLGQRRVPYRPVATLASAWIAFA